MDFSIARQNLYHLLQSTSVYDPNFDVGRAALYLAQQEYPHLEVDAYLTRLDQMAATIVDRLPDDRYPLRVIQIINQYLFEEVGFQGNAKSYYDPRNSYLNEVLDRRTGIPITLSLVYLEIAKRLEFPMLGIGMPGHFLIRPDFEAAGIFVDAFNGGEILFPEDCQARLSQIYGQPIELQPSFLEPIRPQRFLMRLLMNLKGIYLKQRDLNRLVRVLEDLLLIVPDAILERRDRGLAYYQLQRYIEARRDLETYLEEYPNPPDEVQIRLLLDQFKDE